MRTFLLILLLMAAPAAAAEVRVGTLTLPSVNQEGRLLVPVRPLAEALGARVEWAGGLVTVDDRVELRIGSRSARVDGQPRLLDVPAQLIEGRTMLPLRFVAEALGAEVTWTGGVATVAQAEGRTTMTGYIRPLGPNIYMQGTHALEDEGGKVLALLSGKDLDRWLNRKVRVTGRAEPSVEGNQTVLRVERVEPL